MLVILPSKGSIFNIVQFQKISTLLPQKGLEFPGFGKTKNLKTCMKLDLNFQRGGWVGVLKKNTSIGEV